ncbi:hypothetical protein [Halomontanus rarus]|uniref:hypothetical protein n=1 Tax=Halomontanus rarus TaxID=3034020 RepID=UPI0023E86966|nr:hypothetical protein [Halovivax sp. TS33]
MLSVVSDAFPVLAICLAIPVALFLHELGHAVPVVATGGRAHIMIGDTEGRTVETGPVRVTVGSNGIWSLLYFGRCRSDGIRSRTVRAIAILAGPGTTLLVVVMTGVALSVVQHESVRFVVVGLFYNQVWVAFVTLVPVEYPSWFGMYAGDRSDGYRFLKLLRG